MLTNKFNCPTPPEGQDSVRAFCQGIKLDMSASLQGSPMYKASFSTIWVLGVLKRTQRDEAHSCCLRDSRNYVCSCASVHFETASVSLLGQLEKKKTKPKLSW